MSKNRNTYKTFNVNERTPEGFYYLLKKEFGFDYDPCPLNPNPIEDGLKAGWGKRCYINPPYGRQIPFWLLKALEEIEKGNTELAVFLLPAYTDVVWFHDIVLPKAFEIRFIRGRLKFGEHKEAAPFANMLVIFKKREEK